MNALPDPEDLFRRARNALDSGENFLAYDLAASIPDENGVPLPAKTHIMALALARSGSFIRAMKLADELPASGNDSEIDGLKSRLYKDMAVSAADPLEKRRYFTLAADVSFRAFSRTKSWYNGVNAASCRLLGGDAEKARNLVRDTVLPVCLAEKRRDMWFYATLGECLLILGDIAGACENYSKACKIASETRQFGNFSATLRQLGLLAAAIGPSASAVWKCLTLPSVCVFTGHRIDAADRPLPRFPQTAERFVSEQIGKTITARGHQIGFCSCAAGGDILFAESMLAAGGECHVVPPFPLDASIEKCMADVPGNWSARFKKLLDDPGCDLVPPECDVSGEDDDVAYDFVNRYLLGLAKIKARILGLPLHGLAVWDGVRESGRGGTFSAVALWKEQGVPFDVVNPMSK